MSRTAKPIWHKLHSYSVYVELLWNLCQIGSTILEIYGIKVGDFLYHKNSWWYSIRIMEGVYWCLAIFFHFLRKKDWSLQRKLSAPSAISCAGGAHRQRWPDVCPPPSPSKAKMVKHTQGRGFVDSPQSRYLVHHVTLNVCIEMLPLSSNLKWLVSLDNHPLQALSINHVTLQQGHYTPSVTLCN